MREVRHNEDVYFRGNKKQCEQWMRDQASINDPRPYTMTDDLGSELEQLFCAYLKQLAPDLPQPKSNYLFLKHIKREHKFDAAWVGYKVAVEIEGGTWQRGGSRHNRPKGYRDDCFKYNLGVEHGWLILRYTGEMLKENPYSVMQQIRRVLHQRGWAA